MKSILVYLITTLIYLNTSIIKPVQASVQTGAKTTISANIPSRVDIRLYGYTAPNALVQATSIRVFAQVFSDSWGYFLIDPLPIAREAKEICLTTIDAQQRSGFPLCISIENIDKSREIGPLLLSPTISISKSNLIQRQSQQSQATGITLPNADIEISFSENSGSSTVLANSSTPGESFGYPWGVFTALLIHPVEAKDIARITTKTDKYGSYSINLPTTKPLTYRLFARAFYDQPQQAKLPGQTNPDLQADASLILPWKNPTPKSQTLTYIVTSYTSYWLVNIFPRWIIAFIFITALIIFVWYERKTKKGHLVWLKIIERRLKPFEVKTSLKLRRIWYNFQARLKSNQK